MDRIFWTSDVEPDAYRDEYPDASEDELYSIASEDNNTQFQDDKDNLSHIIPENGILIYATLGLWTGKHQAVLQDSSSLHSVGDCMKSYVSGMSDLEFFVSEKGEFQCRETHHDGTNLYTFRAWRSGITDTQKENLINNLYMGKNCDNEIKRKTFRLGDIIGDLCGWKFHHRPEESKALIPF